MHRLSKRKIPIMLTALVLLIGVSVPVTVAYLSVKTEPVMNTFVPVKTPQHDLDITVVGEKKVVDSKSGKSAWKDGDAFNFEVQVWDVNRWKTVGTAAVSYDEDEEDFNKFDASHIIKAQITEAGEYSFRIAETVGTDETITYDETACRFDMVVEADESGAMDITEVKDIEDAEIVKDSESGDYTVAASFTNKYTEPVVPPELEDPEDIKIDFVVDKTVKNTGKIEIGPKGFDFKLVQNSPNSEWTEEVDENGYAAFEMTYTKDDIGKTYLYELSEVNDGVTGVTYSDKVYEISVGITLDEEENKLVADIKVDDKSVNSIKAKFENVYEGEIETEPTVPSEPADKDDGSKTGDDSNMLPVMMIMLACLAVMAVVVISARRRKN